MRAHFLRRTFVCIVTAGLAACSGQDSPNKTSDGSGSGAIGPSLKVDVSKLATPDSALREYIEFRNRKEEATCYWDVAPQQAGSDLENAKIAASNSALFFLTGEAEDRIKHEVDLADCLKYADKLRMEIREVKIESPSRAVVLVNLKNIGLVPEGQSVEFYMKDSRDKGLLYKYEMTKIGNAWKISQVYNYRDYGDNPGWSAYFDPDFSKPTVPWGAAPIGQ